MKHFVLRFLAAELSIYGHLRRQAFPFASTRPSAPSEDVLDQVPEYIFTDVGVPGQGIVT